MEQISIQYRYLEDRHRDRKLPVPFSNHLGRYMVDGHPNFATVAHVGIVDFDTISVSLRKGHHTSRGIRENGTFSVNFPSQDMLEAVDYRGSVSGKKVDKGGKFSISFGHLDMAPMIDECTISMEFRLIQTIERTRHDPIIGSISGRHCDEKFLRGNQIDMGEVDPIPFSMEGKGYWRLGGRSADAWKVGKKLMQRIIR